ncbi:Glutamine-dependent NAD(+) synthetase [Oligella ureolytica]|uniref:Glutamine-dependent NAD(+) synthetase n=2 Tax=Oligella ureolytica TaxID=90244 RepID=A0A378XJ59_9BURK|nr:NAD+ synthase [Oligella ureolytica]QPT39904.1 NAD+ synthase [Oligella ureolytica]SUA57942.1 Glutamine-dependent NAD(+) synthetase [Oligella ureolytica]
MTMTPLTIAMVQAKFVTADLRANIQKIVGIAKKLHRQDVDLLVLPELALPGVAMQDLLLRKSFLLEQEVALQALAKELAQFPTLSVAVGHLSITDDRLLNSVSVLSQGEITPIHHQLSTTEKRQLAASIYCDGLPLSEQKTLQLKGHRFAFSLGSDIWHDGYITQLVSQSVQSVLLLDATPYHMGRMTEFQKRLLDQLGDKAINLFYTNHVGGHDELIYEGRSFLLNQENEFQVEVDHFVEAMVIYQLGADNTWSCLAVQALVSDDIEKNNTSALNLLYQQSEVVESEIWRALVLSTRDFLKNSGINKAMLGLSGGMDSALVLAVLYDAIGPENITAVMLSSQYTSQLSLDLAEGMAKGLGVTYHDISIEPMFKAYMEGLAPIFEDLPADTTEENLQARIRGVILMALSNKLGGMIICSGNKSEAATGYSTLYGDTVGGFAVLKDVPKTLVYRLAKWRNLQEEIIPIGIVTRPPSAELAEGQVDQDSLPEYDILDEILYRLIELKQSSADIVRAGFDADTVDRISRLLKFNEYKRYQTAPGPRISEGAFALDWCYPLSHGFNY